MTTGDNGSFRRVDERNYSAITVNRMFLDRIFSESGGYHEYNPTDSELKELASTRQKNTKGCLVGIVFILFMLALVGIKVLPLITELDSDVSFVKAFAIGEVFGFFAIAVLIVAICVKLFKKTKRENENYDVKLKSEGFSAYVLDCPVTDKTVYKADASNYSQYCLYLNNLILDVKYNDFYRLNIGDRLVFVIRDMDVDIIVCKSDERKNAESLYN